MAGIEDLTIREARELANAFGSIPAATETAEQDLGVQIVILQRGWVVVGHAYKSPDRVRVDNAAVIRRWGTTKGLGELAEKGPLGETVLDSCPPVQTHPLVVVAMMEATANAWNDRR